MLRAGTYRTTTFELPITYTVPEGWGNLEDLPGNFLLIPPGEDLAAGDAGYALYIGVYLHAVPASRDCSTEAKADQVEPGVTETPVAVAAELRERPGLAVTEPRKVEIGGLTGVVVDVRLDPKWTGTCFYSAPKPSVPLMRGLPPSSFDHSMGPGDPLPPLPPRKRRHDAPDRNSGGRPQAPSRACRGRREPALRAVVPSSHVGVACCVALS